MTATLSCEALRDDIIALLYDDGDSACKSRARDHLAQCVPCRAEYSDLKGVRKALKGWDLPVAAPLPQPRSTGRFLAPGLAAAAGLILGIGLALAGRNALAPAAPPASVASGASAANVQFVSHDQLQEALKTQESRHQAEIADLRRSLTLVSEGTASPGGLPAGSLKNVSNLSPATIERLLKASEERQARMFEARLAGLRTESDLQRQYDMAQIAAGLAYIDSRTGADAARTSELMKNLVRVTAKPQDR
jgi:anti-sigma factor RsiW